jgi:CRP/FNR family transcriptional regulator
MVVAEQKTTAAFVPSDTVKRLFDEGPSFRDFVRDQYSRRMAEVIELVEEIAFRKVDERLIQTLAELRSPSGLITSTHQELADHVGTSREVVSRILKDLEQRGKLEISRGSVKLLPAFEKLR